MFIPNKYTECYYNIINNRLSNPLPSDIYAEKHHIIPRSLGGNNVSSNIVSLSAKEHFLCHRLLTKMTNGKDRSKMVYAMNNMLRRSDTQDRYSVTSRTYKHIKEEFSKVNPFASDEFKKKFKTHHVGMKRSEETKSKMSAAWTDERKRKHSEAQRNRMLGKPSSMKGKKNPNLKGEKNGFYGKTHSNQIKERFSKERKGIKPAWYINGSCEHCGKEYHHGTYLKRHEEKCKLKTQETIVQPGILPPSS